MIGKTPYIIALVVLSLTSCDLDGVKSISGEDAPLTTELIDTTDDINLLAEIDPALLDDSIQGLANEMVFQREDGLRIEWTIKKTDQPIQLNDVVMVNYKARVASGEQYDSNDEVGEPVPLKTNIGMMVKGLEAGLLKMNIGDKGRILIPANLGYGENGYSTIVPPDADLIIEIEIVRRIEPIVLDEGVKVYTWKKVKNGAQIEKNQLITFDYFAYTKGEKGKMYDNSYKKSEPFSFRLENDNVIDGLHQGMRVLNQGENAFIEIPASLAYGSKGLVDLVPKNTDIVYDVRISHVDL
jgi:FKBP-type peptidyl-prolyl cis-trans isomerase